MSKLSLWKKENKHCYHLILLLFLTFCQCSSTSSNSDQFNPFSEYEIGKAHYFKSTYDHYLKGLKRLRNVLLEKPDFAEAHAMISLTYSRIGHNYFLKNQTKKASYFYDWAFRHAVYSLKLKPNLSKGYTALALYSRQIQKKEHLIKQAQKAIALNSKEYEAYAILGDGYNPIFFDKWVDFKKSLFYYKKSLSLSPKFLPARYNLAILLFFDKNYHKSIDHLKQAINSNPKIPNLYYYLALSHKEIKQYKVAYSMIQKAMKLYPDNSFYYDLLGEIYFEMNKRKKAILSLKKAIDLNDEIPQFYVHLGIAFNHNGNYRYSILLYKKAISLDPKYDLPHYRLALLLDRAKKYRLAIKKYMIFLDLTDSSSLYKKVYQRVEDLRKLLSQKEK